MDCIYKILLILKKVQSNKLNFAIWNVKWPTKYALNLYVCFVIFLECQQSNDASIKEPDLDDLFSMSSLSI